MTGLIAALAMDKYLNNDYLKLPSENTITGSLLRYVSTENQSFQPMNANFGILPVLNSPEKDKKLRKKHYYNRAISDIMEYKGYILNNI